jgi:hypothetical protein
MCFVQFEKTIPKIIAEKIIFLMGIPPKKGIPLPFVDYITKV